MTPVLSSATLLPRHRADRPGGDRSGLTSRFGAWLSRLLTDGLAADAFLIVSDGRTEAVLLRRPDGLYVLTAREAAARGLEGSIFAEPELAAHAVRSHLNRHVTLAPVWYS